MICGLTTALDGQSGGMMEIDCPVTATPNAE
jgi:hypothetical protein